MLRAPLLWGSIFFLHVVWALSMPLFSSPDEPANFIKAAAVVRGEWIGKNYPANLQVSYWMTVVDIDPRFANAHSVPTCFAFKSDQPACNTPLQDYGPAEGMPATNVGRYPPLAPTIAGLGTVFGVDDRSVFGARIVLAAVCSLLITLGVTALRRRGASGVAVLLALFPGTIFFASTMSPSGLEIAGAIALWCGLLCATGASVDSSTMWAISLGGLAVIGSRPIGFFVYLIILGLVMIHSSRTFELLRQLSKTLIVHAAAIMGMIAWYFIVYDAQSSKSLVAGEKAMALTRQVTHGLESVPRMIDESFGNFGWLDTPMPRLALYLLVGLIAAGMSFGLHGAGWRTISAIGAGMAAIAGMVVVIDVNYYSLFRLFGVQGRHVAPIMVGVILMATSRLGKNIVRDRVLAFSWAALVGWSAWGALRRYSVGIKPDNAFEMFTNAQWSPIIGFWTAVVLLMVAPFLTAFVMTSRRVVR